MSSRLSSIPLSGFTIGVMIFCAVWFLASVIIRIIWDRYDDRALKVWRIVNYAAALVSLAFLLSLTVFGRSRLSERMLILQPFYNIRRAFEYPEFSREKLLNLYLFIPFGLTLSCAAAGRKAERGGRKLYYPGGCPPWAIVLCGFAVSLLIEVVQGVFVIGTAETDDVITNTAGMFLGTVVWYAGELLSGFIINKLPHRHSLL